MNNKRPITPSQALNKAAALCSRCEQASGDILAKLTKWGLGATQASEVISQLTQQGFLDDSRFARAFVKDKFTFNGWGRIKIAYQLRLKGIPSEVVEEAMTAIDEEPYRQRLVELLQTKWNAVSDREPRAAWAAMMRFAASRGFEAGIAAECVKLVTKTDVQND